MGTSGTSRLTNVESLPLSPTILEVFRLAAQYTDVDSIGAEPFLRAAIFHGQNTSWGSARFLADHLIDPNRPLYPPPPGKEYPGRIPTFGFDLAQAFELALSFRSRTGGQDDFIGLRHVLFALALSPETSDTVDRVLRPAGRDAKWLARELIPFLRDSLEPGENWSVWLEIFGQYGLSWVPPEAGDAPVPLSLDTLSLSDGARVLLTEAVGQRGVLTTSLLFMEFVNKGRQRGDAYWAADFLSQAVASFAGQYAAACDAYLKSIGARESGGARLATAGASWVLSRAAALAEQTTGDRLISARHVLAALITDPPPPHHLGSLQLAEAIGIHPPLLRQNFFEWVRGYGDKDDAWRLALLGSDAGPPPLAGFNADDARGPDLLDVERDVRALATLIAASSLVPPLSIGLFGDWGTGKTFLMRQLKGMVDRLSKTAGASHKPQSEVPFFKHIVQIEFNAWHYVEGNLWASLVEHIFRNLRQTGASANSVETMQQHWIEQLGFKETALAAATNRVQAAQHQIDAAQKKVDGLRKEHEAKTKELEDLSAKNVARDFQLAGVTDVVKKALAPLGLQPLGAAVTDLQSSLRQARSVLERGDTVITPLIHASDRKRRWRWLLAILIGGPLTGFLVGAALDAMGKHSIEQISSIATAAAAILATGAGWIRRQGEWMKARLDDVEKANRGYDEALGREQAEMAKAIAGKEQELALARQEYAAAEQAAGEARREHEAVRQELANTTPGQLLGRFIEDRASSTDYRKHLGVLAVIRDDFQELSSLIERENDRLSKLKRLEEETPGQDKRVNRIVLYIDDLDRCPPNKVIDVLQAVHLLLAFPLFVVVVGVDARWISRSLETKYRELLRVDGTDSAAQAGEMFGALRSDDYLEKIFQVPLWLRPLDSVSVRRMVQGLLRPARIAPPAQDRTVASPPAPAAGGKPDLTPTAPVAAAQTAPKPERPATSAGSAPAPPAANVESLEIRDFEVDMIEDLAPLLGRSPRALKRFVNVYRLIKAGLTPAELAVFVRSPPQAMGEYQAVLFLLAIDTGLPQVSRSLFDFLRRETGVRDPNVPIENGIRRLFNLPDSSQLESKPDWRKLKAWVLEQKENRYLANAMPQLIAWAPRVSRYSFQAAQAE